jgi:hydrogenase nickel incorporation protein HypA/HybF
MHELSIAVSLVDLACDEARRLGDATVDAIYVRLGALAGVVKDPLLFSFELAKQGTEISAARLEIEDVPVTVWCSKCASERVLSDVRCRRCPVCNAATPQILRGDELELFALEVQDASTDR